MKKIEILNAREIMENLLIGHKIQPRGFPPEEYFYLNEDGFFVDEEEVVCPLRFDFIEYVLVEPEEKENASFRIKKLEDEIIDLRMSVNGKVNELATFKKRINQLEVRMNDLGKPTPLNEKIAFRRNDGLEKSLKTQLSDSTN